MPPSRNVAESPEMDLEEFRDGGYLSAVNINVLHPVGLALGYDPASGRLMILDSRDDPEGVFMAAETLEVVRDRMRNFEREWGARQPARRSALGYMIQPYAEDEG